MVSINEIDKKLELEYPCSWCFKIIGEDRVLIERLVCEMMQDRDHTLTHSNSSSSGKYLSLNLDLVVQSDDDRETLFKTLRDSEHVKRVL